MGSPGPAGLAAIDAVDPAPAAAPDAPAWIELHDWGIRHGRRRLLDGINLALHGPGTLVLMGPAGTGKSTLLKAMAGVQAAHARQWGRIAILGQPPSPANASLLQQHPRDLASSVAACLAVPLRADQLLAAAELRQRITAHLRQLQLDVLEPLLDTPLLQLPRGLARLTLIARAAAWPCPVLLLDEPTSDLEPAEAEAVLALVQRLAAQRLCVVSLHHQGQARRIADRVLLLAGGRVQVEADNPPSSPMPAATRSWPSSCAPAAAACPRWTPCPRSWNRKPKR